MDAAEEKRADSLSWMKECINQLLQEIDEFTATELQVKKSSKCKQWPDVALNQRMQELHRFHAHKLEQLLRKLENQDLDVDSLAVVKDSLDCYLDPQKNPRTTEAFAPYDKIYDELQLEEHHDNLAQSAAHGDEDLEDEDQDGLV